METLRKQLVAIATTMGYHISYRGSTSGHLAFTIYDDSWNKHSSVFISCYRCNDGRIKTLSWPQLCGAEQLTFKKRDYYDKQIIGIFLVMLQKGKAAIS